MSSPARRSCSTASGVMPISQAAWSAVRRVPQRRRTSLRSPSPRAVSAVQESRVSARAGDGGSASGGRCDGEGPAAELDPGGAAFTAKPWSINGLAGRALDSSKPMTCSSARCDSGETSLTRVPVKSRLRSAVRPDSGDTSLTCVPLKSRLWSAVRPDSSERSEKSLKDRSRSWM